MGAEAATAVPPSVHRIGPYSIVSVLGAGGNGRVYLGERLVGGAVQRVAVKVLSRSAAGSGFTERFAREQHILASLNHANITRMLDAGMSDDGEPYLVMEYVDGEHLDTWCDESKLGVRERLQLFLHVCEPVAYAHRNLVVHLDIKPSNVLIAREDGVVKLLDFGTSKLVQPDSLLTTTVMATPAYASPEQLLNEPVTTVCDVYALGAVLFELLSGKRPNRDISVALLIERSMKETAPESLHEAVTQEAADRRALTQTRLRVALEGDLETIVTKCLAARPKDRYATVDALIEDVQRYLAGRPILARPQTTTYRLGKFVRRNRAAVVAGGVMAFCLIGVTSYAVWRQEQAVRAGRRAEQMQNFMYQLFKLANSNYTGKPAATVPEFLQLGVKVLPDFIKDPADQRAAQLSLAESMFDNKDFTHAQPVFMEVIASSKTAGDIGSEAEAEGFAGNIAFLLGQSAQSRDLEAHALSLSHRPGVTPAARIWIESFYAGDEDSSGFRTDQTLKILEDAVSESRSAHLPDRERAAAMFNLASSYNFRGDPDKAEALAKETLSIYQGEPYALCDRSDVYYLLGDIHYVRGDFQGSLPLYRSALEGYTACQGPASSNVFALQLFTARSLLKLGKAKSAINLIEAALSYERKVSSGGANVIAPLVLLAHAYVADGQYSKAESAIREAMELQKGNINSQSSAAAVADLVLAQALAGQQHLPNALVHAEAAEKIYRNLSKMTPSEKNYAAQTHALLLILQSKLSGETLPDSPVKK